MGRGSVGWECRPSHPTLHGAHHGQVVDDAQWAPPVIERWSFIILPPEAAATPESCVEFELALKRRIKGVGFEQCTAQVRESTEHRWSLGAS